MKSIPRSEFLLRIDKIRSHLDKLKADLFIVYGDEYRRENLRYVSNYWPIFERGLLVIGLNKDPVLLVSAECEHLAKEMTIWDDIRLLREIGMSYVPEEVGFVNVNFTSLNDVVEELTGGKQKKRIMISGFDSMSVDLFKIMKSSIKNAEILNGDGILYDLRLIKSKPEIDMLKESGRICDVAYKKLLDSEIIGLTETRAAAIAEKAAYDAGAESIVFSIFCSGNRTNTVVGRPTEKIIKKDEMIMSSLAIQYGGYIASVEWPFVAGNKPNDKQKRFLYHLVNSEQIGIDSITAGVVQGEVVAKISSYFKENDLEKYDLYPPIHGNGLSEAESPYPDKDTKKKFLPGMGINFDVSLFGLPGVGSNRIEEGFIIGEKGMIDLSKLIPGLRNDFLGK